MDSKALLIAMESNFSTYTQLLTQLQDIQFSATADQAGESLKKILERQLQLDDEVVDFRLMKILREENPYLPQIDPKKVDTRPLPLSNALETFLELRRQLIHRLSIIPQDHWHRTGFHAIEGHVTFGELVRRMIEKDSLSIGKVKRLYEQFEQQNSSISG